MSQWDFYNLRICKNIFANTRKEAYYKVTHGFVLSGSLAGNSLLKLSENVRETGPKLSWNVRELFLVRFDSLCNKKNFAGKSSSFTEYWQNIITWGKCYSIQETFRRILVVFLQSWMFLHSCELFANFVQIILQRNFCCKTNFIYRNLACFALLAFYYNFLFNIFSFLQMCAKMCADFVRLCAKIVFTNYLA